MDESMNLQFLPYFKDFFVVVLTPRLPDVWAEYGGFAKFRLGLASDGHGAKLRDAICEWWMRAEKA